MNQSGQEGAGYRLIIEAIVALLILTIILGAVGWVTVFKFYLSDQMFFEGFSRALESPNGDPIVQKNLVFAGDRMYTTRVFERYQISGDCITFDAANLSALNLGESRNVIGIEKELLLDVYYRCLGQQQGDCETLCEVSFGKEFE